MKGEKEIVGRRHHRVVFGVRPIKQSSTMITRAVTIAVLRQAPHNISHLRVHKKKEGKHEA